MNTAPSRPARLRAWAAAAIAAAVVITGGIAATAPAAAAPNTVSAGSLTWGVDEAWGTMFVNNHTAVAPATKDAATRTFTFPAVANSAFDPETQSGTVSFSGAARIGYMIGAPLPGVTAGNYFHIANPTVTISGTTGTLSGTTAGDSHSTNPDLPTAALASRTVATIDLSTAPTLDDSRTVLTWTAVPTAITEGGAQALATYETAGDAAAGKRAVGSALAPLTFSVTLAEPIPADPEPVVPTISVSKTSGLSPAGETVTVTGTGFSPVAPATTGTRPPLAGTFGGAYVVFGTFLDAWKPSTGVGSSARKVADQKWVVNPENTEALGAQAVAINPDGSFTTTLTVSKDFAGALAAGNYGIYTYPGGGATYAPFETYTPITFDTTTPVVSVSKTTGLSLAAETVTVRAWNFGDVGAATTAPANRPPLGNKFGGVYVTFGKFADTWKASAAAPSSARNAGDTKWVVNAADVTLVDRNGTGSGVAINADGSFTTTVKVDPTYAAQPATGNFGIYTYAGGGVVYAPFETATPLTFVAGAATTTTLAATPAAVTEGDTVTLTATVAPAVAGTVTFSAGAVTIGAAPVTNGVASITTTSVAGTQSYSASFVPAAPVLYAGSTGTTTVTAAAKAVGAGSLTWGVRDSFRSYITGPIAKGSITSTGVANANGVFTFGQSGAGTFNPATGLGSAPYSGSVRFFGHAGELDITLANPSITVTSPTAAELWVTVNGAQVRFATLNLGAATKTTPNNTVRYAGAPATLTAQGSSAFNGFYQPGEALDAVTFVLGSVSGPTGGTTTAAFTSLSRTPADNPPATTGVTLGDGVDAGALEEGEEYTFTADGFTANETGILAVIYSTPTVLSSAVKADASGAVTWTGALPQGLTGDHTFTFQGSVNRGIEVTIAPAAAATTALDGCSVEDASLTWGFKESFRSYISGSIANGEWTVADGAEYATPNFSWADGTGVYDAETATGELAFIGSIRFTGHGGVLDTTVANPVIRFIDEDRAVVLLDVSGTTQDGSAVQSDGVEFVELDLSTATVEAVDGAVTITDAPATLTAAGAAAFGTYPEGEAFDALTVAFTTADCAAEAVPADGAASTDVDAEPVSDTGFPWIWIVLALVVLIAIIIVVAVVLRRRRTAE